MGTFTININSEDNPPIVSNLVYTTNGSNCGQVTFQVLSPTLSDIPFVFTSVDIGNHGFTGGLYKTNSSYTGDVILSSFTSSTSSPFERIDTDVQPLNYYKITLCARATLDPPNLNEVEISINLFYNEVSIIAINLTDDDS
jgi:hypothetical protein